MAQGLGRAGRRSPSGGCTPPVGGLSGICGTSINDCWYANWPCRGGRFVLPVGLDRRRDRGRSPEYREAPPQAASRRQSRAVRAAARAREEKGVVDSRVEVRPAQDRGGPRLPRSTAGLPRLSHLEFGLSPPPVLRSSEGFRLRGVYRRSAAPRAAPGRLLQSAGDCRFHRGGVRLRPDALFAQCLVVLSGDKPDRRRHAALSPRHRRLALPHPVHLPDRRGRDAGPHQLVTGSHTIQPA